MTLRRIVPLFVLVASRGACGDSDVPSETARPKPAPATKPADDGAASDAVTVLAKGLTFVPEKVTVATGGIVTWKMDDGTIPHNVVGDDFASKNSPRGPSTTPSTRPASSTTRAPFIRE